MEPCQPWGNQKGARGKDQKKRVGERSLKKGNSGTKMGGTKKKKRKSSYPSYVDSKKLGCKKGESAVGQNRRVQLKEEKGGGI